MDAVGCSPHLLCERRFGGPSLGFLLQRFASVNGQLGVRPAKPEKKKKKKVWKNNEKTRKKQTKLDG